MNQHESPLFMALNMGKSREAMQLLFLEAIGVRTKDANKIMMDEKVIQNMDKMDEKVILLCH